jgi:hypothetical protein
MPHVRNKLGLIVLGLVVASSLFALVTYRTCYLPSLDESAGGWDGLVAATVDVGLACGVTALLTLSLLFSLFASTFGWIVQRAEYLFRLGEPPTDAPDPPAEFTDVPPRGSCGRGSGSHNELHR